MIKVLDLFELSSYEGGIKSFYKVINKLEENKLLKFKNLLDKGSPKIVFPTDDLITFFFSQFDRVNPDNLLSDLDLSSCTRALIHDELIKEVVFSWEREEFERLKSRFKPDSISVLEGGYKKNKFNIGCTLGEFNKSSTVLLNSLLGFSDDPFYSYVVIFFKDKELFIRALRTRDRLNQGRVKFNSKKFVFVLSDSGDFNQDGSSEWICKRDEEEFLFKELYPGNIRSCERGAT